MQMVFTSQQIPGREPEVFPDKMVQIGFRGEQQRQGIQQAGFTPGVFPNQHVVVLQHQRQTVNAAKPHDFHTFQQHVPSGRDELFPLSYQEYNPSAAERHPIIGGIAISKFKKIKYSAASFHPK